MTWKLMCFNVSGLCHHCYIWSSSSFSHLFSFCPTGEPLRGLLHNKASTDRKSIWNPNLTAGLAFFCNNSSRWSSLSSRFSLKAEETRGPWARLGSRHRHPASGEAGTHSCSNRSEGDTENHNQNHTWDYFSTFLIFSFGTVVLGEQLSSR